MRIAVITLVAASIAAGATACGGAAQFDDTRTSLRAPPPPPLPPIPGFEVRYSGLTAEVHVLELVARDDGEVAAVQVAVGQRVRAGDVLVELAADDKAARVDEAERTLAEAEQDLATASQQLTGYEMTLKLYADPAYQRKQEQLRAPDRNAVRYAEAEVTVARVDRERLQKLFDAGAVSRNELDSAIAAESAAQARLAEVSKQKPRSDLRAEYLEHAMTVIRTEVELATAARATAAKALADAQRTLDATRVVATASGVIADVMVVPGSWVSRDEPVVHLSTWQP